MCGCDIIIPVWNQRRATERCLDSIEKNTAYPYRLIIIDNASSPETSEFLEHFRKTSKSDITLVRNAKNEGFIKAVNKGAQIATSEYMCIMNNDTVVCKGWLAEMIRVIEKDPCVGIVNPSSNNLGQRMPKGVSMDEYAKSLKGQSGQYAELGSALGFCMLTRKKTFDEIGPFDEVYGMGNFEDTDFSYRVKSAGYKAVRALSSYVLHEESSSFKLLKFFKRDFERNRKIFEARWGKPKRLLFILSGKRKDKFLDIVDKEIGKNNWVYIAQASNGMFPENGHSRMIVYNLAAYFAPRVVWKIIFKRKRFDEIYCDSTALMNVIRLLTPIHKARLLPI